MEEEGGEEEEGGGKSGGGGNDGKDKDNNNDDDDDGDRRGGIIIGGGGGGGRRDLYERTFAEIEKVRKRWEAGELHLEEMDRLKAEESRMKELENYDEWARKEEEFHLGQQRQRSAIRLVEGRERPVDVLAPNILLFGCGGGAGGGGGGGVEVQGEVQRTRGARYPRGESRGAVCPP